MAMQASAADVRSILGTPSLPHQPPQRKPSAPTAKKPEGISRELYSLIGDSTPLLAAQLAKPRLKQKPNLNSGGKVKWELRPFKNNARSDSLQLSHWVKASSDPNAEYPFAKYNVGATAYTYSTDEYMKLLTDPEWTKEETDYLFKIVYEYDLRWYIIYDRYEYAGSNRSLEDLKDRYYGVCRKLVRSRPWAGDQASLNSLLSTLSFDKEKELSRKKYIQSLGNRTPEQIAEEEALFIEIKRLEQTERKFKKDREDLLRKIAGIDSGLPDIVDDDHGLSLTIDTKRRKKGLLDESPTPSFSPPVIKRPQNPKNAAYDAQHCIIRTELPATTPATKAAHTPSYLRSYKLPNPKAAVAPKVMETLSELGITYNRLVMPTRENIAQLESLVDAALTLLDVKKAVDKVEYDISVAKARLGIQDAAVKDETAMDVDEEAGFTDGRAGSVVSTRSRGRRSQRSVSVSSVDTSATGRIKRQKRT